MPSLERTCGASEAPIGAPYGKTVGFVTLGYKAPQTLRRTFESYRAGNLFRYFDDVVICFQSFSDADARLAEELGVRYVGRPDNLGICGGFRWCWETLKTDYVLIMETDLALCVPQATAEAQLQESLWHLEKGEVDLVRLRNRFNPGEQNRFASMYSRFWVVRDKDPRWADTESLDNSPAWVKALRRGLRPGKATRWCGRSPYIERTPERLFPKWIKRIGDDFFCVDSWVLPWTNQCTLISRTRLGELLDYADAHPSVHCVNAEHNKLQTLEPQLNRLWWRRKHFRIGVPEGIFTHSRIDR